MVLDFGLPEFELEWSRNRHPWNGRAPKQPGCGTEGQGILLFQDMASEQRGSQCPQEGEPGCPPCCTEAVFKGNGFPSPGKKKKSPFLQEMWEIWWVSLLLTIEFLRKQDVYAPFLGSMHMA